MFKSAEELKEITKKIRIILLALTDAERELVMKDFMDIYDDGFCNYCWRKLGLRECCYCMNDE